MGKPVGVQQKTILATTNYIARWVSEGVLCYRGMGMRAVPCAGSSSTTASENSFSGSENSFSGFVLLIRCRNGFGSACCAGKIQCEPMFRNVTGPTAQSDMSILASVLSALS